MAQHRKGAPLKWNPSGVTIFNLAMATFLAVWFLTDTSRGLISPKAAPTAAAAYDNQSANFGFCHIGGGLNCVVDGDTIWYQGNKIRIADIDTPETHPSRCAEEARLGSAATERLQALLNAGPFSVAPIERDTDIYGRQLRVLSRGGESIGGQLVSEGLARWYGGGRRPWC